MQNNNLTHGLCVALIVASPLAGAAAYPEPFEPQVVYQDSDYIAKSKEGTAAAPAAATPSSSKAADTTKYPPGFEPEILFQDPEAIKKATGTATISSRSDTSRTESSASATPVAAPGNPLTDNLPIVGGAALALLGILFWSKRSPKGAAASAPVAAPAVAPVIGGETGVAKYLRTVTGVGAETGVARYLKNLPAAAASAVETGVSRYLKSLPATSSSAAETGVAKYLKKVG